MRWLLTIPPTVDGRFVAGLRVVFTEVHPDAKRLVVRDDMSNAWVAEKKQQVISRRRQMLALLPSICRAKCTHVMGQTCAELTLQR